MIWVLILVIGLSILGFPILRALSPSSEVALAPAFGLGAVIFGAYILSANFGFSGADSSAISIAFWAAIALAWLLPIAVNKPRWRLDLGSKSMILIFAAMPGLLLLLPAMRYGVPNFFGAVNFDFFYNSRDSAYLAEHSVLQFTGKTDEILPFIWSSDAQGRFGINLLSSFFVKFLNFNPVHFNAILISALVIINALAFYAFSKEIYKFSRIISLFSVFFIVLSAGFSQGYTYYLLGQISASPLFTAALILGPKLITSTENGYSDKRSIFAVIFILNALYIFYAILSVFAALVIAFSIILLAILRRIQFRSLFAISATLICGTLAVFVLVRLFSLDALLQSVSSWISLSVKTASADGSSPAIFSEYTLEPFLLLVFGMVAYPTAESPISQLVGFGPNRGLILIALGLLTLASFVLALLAYLRSRLPWPEKAVVASIALTALSSSVIFFATGSGYSLFKISDWLIPYLMPVFLTAILLVRKAFNSLRALVALLSAMALAVNVSTAIAYTSPFWLLSGERGVNAYKINGMSGIDELKRALLPYPYADVLLDLKNGIRNAWIANEFAGQRNLASLTNNFQPLTDRLLPSTPCSSHNSFKDRSILISDTDRADIIVKGLAFKPFFVGRPYSATFVSDIDQYTYLGRGAYLVENLPEGASITDSFPGTFRWIERGVELYYFTRKAGHVDLSFEAAPGYVDGPVPRNLKLSGAGVAASAFFDQRHSHVGFEALPVIPGLNCFYIESPDNVSARTRYGAVVRNDTQIDFRLLNFAVGNISIIQRD